MADDRFVWFTDGQKRYATPEAILKSIAAFAAQGMTFTTEYSQIDPRPLTRDLAVVSSKFKTEVRANNEEVFSYAGVSTMVLERSEEQGWRVLAGHSSTPGGPPGDEPQGK